MKSQAFVQNLIEIFPKGAPLSVPSFHGTEWDYVKDCIDTGWVSSAGSYVTKFENQLSQLFGGAHVIAASTGTAALHLCCLAAGVKRGDEVLIPDFTFVATANAVTYGGAIPHLVDVDENSFGVDPEKLRSYLEKISKIESGVCFNAESGRPIRALVVMHTFGHPSRMDEILEVCQDFKIQLIEDAAEALGSKLDGKPLARHGVISAVSFNGNKIVTTGGGGAVVTHDKKIADHVRHISTTAKCQPRTPGEFYHDEVGYNYRLPNLNAALGCAQLEDLPRRVEQRRSWTETYVKILDGLGCGSVFQEREGCESNYWLQAFILSPELAGSRNEILEAANASGIQLRPAWNLMSSLPMFKDAPQMNLDVARDLFERTINLPSSEPQRVETP